MKAIGLIYGVLFAAAAYGQTSLLNVSYDPTRELYKEYNAAFAKHWKAQTGAEVTVDQSHGGSGKQARAVVDGLEADVVTLALSYDVDALRRFGGLLQEGWQQRLPHNSSPYTSTIVFLVRKGNPKKILDWGDLVKPGVKIITPNPKTSGAARWSYLASWGWACETRGGDEGARAFMKALFAQVPVLDSGARGATVTFAQRNIGDVLLAWENEAFLAVKEFPAKGFEIVMPSVSILAEPPVAVVDKVVDRKKTRAVAEAYLKHLYSVEGQTIAAKNFYRPSDTTGVPPELMTPFKQVRMYTIDKDFAGWAQAQKTHFDEGGTFDQIMKK